MIQRLVRRVMYEVYALYARWYSNGHSYVRLPRGVSRSEVIGLGIAFLALEVSQEIRFASTAGIELPKQLSRWGNSIGSIAGVFILVTMLWRPRSDDEYKRLY